MVHRGLHDRAGGVFETSRAGGGKRRLTQMNTDRAFKKVLHFCLCFLSVAVCVPNAFGVAASTAAAISLTDDLGRKVELAHPAQRIVTLAPFLTELAFSAGAGKRVVGASAFSDYPPEARALPEVASAAGIALESLAALHSDLVLAWGDTIRP